MKYFALIYVVQEASTEQCDLGINELKAVRLTSLSMHMTHSVCILAVTSAVDAALVPTSCGALAVGTGDGVTTAGAGGFTNHSSPCV